MLSEAHTQQVESGDLEAGGEPDLHPQTSLTRTTSLRQRDEERDVHKKFDKVQLTKVSRADQGKARSFLKTCVCIR